MAESTNISTEIFETAMTAENPVRVLMNMAATLLENKDPENFHDIDVMLNGRFMDYIRRGSVDDLNTFVYDLLSFIDSSNGDRLKSFVEEGEKFLHRWEHLCDLCDVAVENYDPQLTARFVASRKHGKKLMEILRQDSDGVRFRDVAEKLGISQQNLAKLLREFERHDLIVRERHKHFTLVRLDFVGKAYMAENEPESSVNKLEKIMATEQPFFYKSEEADDDWPACVDAYEGPAKVFLMYKMDEAA